jgi:hypothetical protein
VAAVAKSGIFVSNPNRKTCIIGNKYQSHRCRCLQQAQKSNKTLQTSSSTINQLAWGGDSAKTSAATDGIAKRLNENTEMSGTGIHYLLEEGRAGENVISL